MVKMGNAYEMLSGKSEGKRSLWRHNNNNNNSIPSFCLATTEYIKSKEINT
jgi:hypothetical protein